MRAGSLDGSLRPRIVGLAESLRGPSWFGLLVETGKAHVAGEDDAILGPALAWRPWPKEAKAMIAAGTTGSYVVLGTTALASAAGYMPETRELREAADRSFVESLVGQTDKLRRLRSAFDGVLRELRSDDVAARAVAEAYLRVILVEVYRSGSAVRSGGERASPSHRAFSRFSELVESHFRERWTVNDYARGLGMSRDRLGDICVRTRGMGPKELIDRRVAVEARLQLENSSSSIQQIADYLGFHSPPQFTRFFSRTMGVPPGQYRRANARHTAASDEPATLPYEWP